ncbi:hypothetical protein HID58_017363 [Brassica napus]|uniref:Uncharacterized protein n=1 Tax=Brassica napus TaxID=3708 RepID=A0ABQ8D6V6_BRANA|nr:hypothetical protein HID58_017363 [Brassica napus]
MSTEYLNQRYLQRRNLSMHEHSRQVQLHLETQVNIRPVNRRRPPESESSIRNLVKTRPLCVRQLLVLHRLLETRRLLPEKTLPRWEVSPLEEGMLEDTLYASESLYNIGSVVVQVPQLPVMPLVCPPEWVLFQDLVLLKLGPHPPAFIIC